MILVADGGSTKVDWRLVKDGKEVARLQTRGINPYFRTSEDIIRELEDTLTGFLEQKVPDAVYFYGAGCANDEVNDIIRFALYDSIGCKQVDVRSDLWGAARGLCGKEKGIACILGTGSNSCYYDGEQVTQNVSPLGYILGDEGSGAVLGRLFLGACLKNRLTSGIKEEFLERYELTPAIILEKVYRQPMPNRFLAQFTPFLLEYSEDSSVRIIIQNSFRDFLQNNVMQYDYKEHPIHFTGSVAFHFQHILREVAASLHINPAQITPSPMEGLISYHS